MSLRDYILFKEPLSVIEAEEELITRMKEICGEKRDEKLMQRKTEVLSYEFSRNPNKKYIQLVA